MESTTHEKIGQEILERTRLLQTARGPAVATWGSFVADRVKGMAAACGAVLVYFDFVEPLSHSWLMFLGIALLVLGLWPRRDRSNERLDALLEFLDRKGLLTATDAPLREKASA